MKLIRDRFVLRTWQMEDKTSLIKYANNIKVWRNVRDRFPYPYTEKDAVDWITLCAQQHPPTNFAICIKGEACGGIGLMPEEDIYRYNMEIGYWLGEPFWGSGIMREAIEAVVTYAFEQLGTYRVYGKIFGENKASQKVLRRAGFRKEAHIKNIVVKEGEWQDEVIMGIRNTKFQLK